MDGANFISKVVNDITANVENPQHPDQVAAQADPTPEQLQEQFDGAAPLIAGLSVDQVEEIYHSVVQARQDGRSSDVAGLDRAMVMSTMAAALQPEALGAGFVE